MAEPHTIPTDPRFQDLRNKTFGKLTVLFYAGRRSGKYSLWHCRCECGQERTCVSSQLTLGRSTSCVYCFRHRPKTKIRSDFQDLTGQTFGRLTVLSLNRRVKRPGSRIAYWNCLCKCGEHSVVRGDSLKDGTVASCGCLNVARKWLDQPIPSEAECIKCHNTLPLTVANFYRHPKQMYGFRLICKPCARLISRNAGRRLSGALRLQCLEAYSGSPPKCQCPGCTETHIEFLTIDHINGGGSAHRRSISGNTYSWLRRNGFPEGFRVLCYNCNCSRGTYGYCPHDR